ncbi:tRNA (adenosine(37)-N6)-dimethylallyltransferase MiaA [Deferribacteres bacterium DY0037]
MRIPVITGPTAAGKTAVVLGLAERYNIEIISADAYQVYKYMDIGTAKADSEELKKAPHHLIDIYTPDKTYSAGVFFEQAQKCIRDILGRGNIPVVAGGTGMYVETLQKGIFAGPDRDENIRRDIEDQMEQKGAEALYEELAGIDPAFAEKIKPADRARIMRGLELNRQLKMNVGDAQAEFHRNPDYDYAIFVLTEEREKIYDRINRRVDLMINSGWEKEVQKLLEMGYSEKLDSFKAIGYRDIAGCIRDKVSVDTVSEKIKTRTRNFAKRQLTWFRHMSEIKYVDLSDANELKRLDKFFFT